MSIFDGATGLFSTAQIYLLRKLEQLVDAASSSANSAAAKSNTAIVIPVSSAEFSAVSKSSNTAIPAGALIVQSYLRCDVAFDGSATIEVGHSGSVSELLATTDTDLSAATVPNVQGGVSLETWPVDAHVLVTFGGTPSVGSGEVVIIYQPIPRT